MGVHTTSHFYDSHGRPFRSKAKGVANHRDGGYDPTELEHQFNRRTPPDRWKPHQP